MIRSLLGTAKRVLGKNLYNDIRARILFGNLETLYPLYPETPFAVNWDRYQRPEDKQVSTLRSAYIVAPSQRSGTNFLNNMLNMHPDIVFPWGPDLPGEQGLFTYTDYLKEYAYKTVSIWNKWVEGGEEALNKHAKGMVQSMGEGIINYFGQYAAPGQTLLFKTPDTGHLDNFFHAFPHTKVIILVRDGRDTVESFLKSWGGRFAFKKICIRWSQRVDLIWDFMEKVKRSGFEDMVHLVRYDHLNDNTAEELKKILKFMEIDDSRYPWEELNQLPVVGSSSLKNKEKEVHWKPVKKSRQIKLKQKWLHWNKYKKEVFKRIAGDNLVKLGFEKNNNW